jgi:ABC-2 type transport system ATP-binding protein
MAVVAPIRPVQAGRMLTINGLSKRYGEVQAIDGVDLTVPPGRLVGFVGPNGAGKSTTMRAVFGLVAPDAGEILLDGTTIDGGGLRRIGYLPEQRGLYPKMAIGHQVRYFAQLKGVGKTAATEAADRLRHELGLGDRTGDALDALSHGNQQRVQLAVALVHRPDLLILDEPFNGLDPVAVEVLQQLLVERAARGTGILFSSHQLDLVERLCTDVVVIDGGRILAAGDLGDLRRQAGRTLDVAVDRPLVPVLDAVRAALPGEPQILASSTRMVRLALDDDRSLDHLLTALRDVGEVTRFQFGPPSLSDLFASIIGSGNSNGAAGTPGPGSAPLPEVSR